MMLQNTQKLILGFLFVLTGDHYAEAQSVKNNSFFYDDVFGNTISFSDIEKIPSPFDTSFFKSHLNGLHFNHKLTEQEFRFYFSVTNIKIIEPEKEFEFRVFSSPKTKSSDLIIRHRGYSFYHVAIRKINGEIIIETVERTSIEI